MGGGVWIKALQPFYRFPPRFLGRQGWFFFFFFNIPILQMRKLGGWGGAVLVAAPQICHPLALCLSTSLCVCLSVSLFLLLSHLLSFRRTASWLFPLRTACISAVTLFASAVPATRRALRPDSCRTSFLALSRIPVPMAPPPRGPPWPPSLKEHLLSQDPLAPHSDLFP